MNETCWTKLLDPQSVILKNPTGYDWGELNRVAEILPDHGVQMFRFERKKPKCKCQMTRARRILWCQIMPSFQFNILHFCIHKQTFELWSGVSDRRRCAKNLEVFINFTWSVKIKLINVLKITQFHFRTAKNYLTTQFSIQKLKTQFRFKLTRTKSLRDPPNQCQLATANKSKPFGRMPAPVSIQFIGP
jgi:hypothetical protein